MDNPWAVWDVRDRDTSSWSADAPQWPATQATWVQGDTSWDSSANATSDQDNTTQDQRSVPHSPVSAASEPQFTTVISDQQSACYTSPPRRSPDPVPETTDVILASVPSAAGEALPENPLNLPDDTWSSAWGTTPPDIGPKQVQPSDRWEAGHQEREGRNRTVPPESLDFLLRHCQQVLQDIWPVPETNDEDNSKSGFDAHADTTALLAQLVPTDSTLLPTVQFSATAIARAMNEALKLTRRLPTSSSSPLSRLLASKGSLEWEKSIKARQDVIPDTAYVGWRVVEREDRLNSLEESKPRKAAGGLLSFWSRRVSAIQAVPVEMASERSSSPPRSSLESAKSAPHLVSSRAASPSMASTSVPLPPSTDPRPTVVATAPASTAVSRFWNRFSRVKGAQNIPLALSSDDLEFLSDIVPSAGDPPDEDVNSSVLDSLGGASNLSALPPKLPPPNLPPPKQPTQSGLTSPVRGLGALNSVDALGSTSTALQMQTANYTPNVPVLAPPLSPKPVVSSPYAQGPPSTLRDAKTTILTYGQPSTPAIQQKRQSSHSPLALPPQMIPPSLSIPPLLPPPISPPQTPRPSMSSSIITSGHLSVRENTSATSFYDSDDEFSAFASFPPSSFPVFPSSEPYSSQRPPSPPSPPPRRTYERTHYPSSSSTSSILSPASQTSLEQLCSTKPSISTSLDSFDDFVSPPIVARVEDKERRPSLPPLPAKPPHQQPPRLDTSSSRICYAHTPSQTIASPTVHTSLMNNAFSMPSVSDAEHQRTQGLVSHAAARGGILWPNSPDSDEPRPRAIPPPPTSTFLDPLIREEGFDLLGDGDTLGGSGKGLGLRNQLQSSPLSLTSTPPPILSFSLAKPAPLTGSNTKSLQPTKPKQTGGLSAQDLSFFEGL